MVTFVKWIQKRGKNSRGEEIIPIDEIHVHEDHSMYMYVCIYVFTCMYVCVYVYIYMYMYICNIYNMDSRCVSAISDLNPEIAARGKAEGFY